MCLLLAKQVTTTWVLLVCDAEELITRAGSTSECNIDNVVLGCLANKQGWQRNRPDWCVGLLRSNSNSSLSGIAMGSISCRYTIPNGDGATEVAHNDVHHTHNRPQMYIAKKEVAREGAGKMTKCTPYSGLGTQLSMCSSASCKIKLIWKEAFHTESGMYSSSTSDTDCTCYHISVHAARLSKHFSYVSKLEAGLTCEERVNICHIIQSHPSMLDLAKQLLLPKTVSVSCSSRICSHDMP